MPPTVDFFKKYPNQHFVETGTWHGDGVQCARQAGFDSVRSIELSQPLYERCRNRFKDDNRVKLYQGDSGVVLGSVISDINEPITFWLDAHYSEGDTVKGPCMSPVLQELEAIAKHHVKTHTILIDDHHDFFTDKFGGVTEDQAKEAIRKIDPCYKFQVVDDILVAKIEHDGLTKLADKYGSDKGLYGYYDLPWGHKFTTVYSKLFGGIREKVKSVLEIGVDKGASLKMWRDYFPNAGIWGIDIEPVFLEERRIDITQADQGCRACLKKIKDQVIDNDLDIIIEDGSHQNNHQQQTFAALFCLLREGGIYVIEDVHCGRLNHGGPGPNTLSVFQQYVKDGTINTPFLKREQILYLKRTIGSCVVHNVPGTPVPGGSELIVFTKKQPKIVIVGNGPSLIGSSLGEKIDEFDIVVRLNRFRTKGFEKDIGTRTSIWWRSDCNNIEDQDLPFEDILISIMPRTDAKWVAELLKKYEGRSTQVPFQIHYDVHEILDLGNVLTSPKWPSTGMIAIEYFIQQYGEISICGFDGFSGKAHYWDDSSPHLEFHVAEKEREYVQELEQRGIVEVL